MKHSTFWRENKQYIELMNSKLVLREKLFASLKLFFYLKTGYE